MCCCTVLESPAPGAHGVSLTAVLRVKTHLGPILLERLDNRVSGGRCNISVQAEDVAVRYRLAAGHDAGCREGEQDDEEGWDSS